MGAAKLRAATRPTDYFLSSLFAPEQPSPVTPELVVAHEVGHAIANTLLDYPIEFTSVKWELDNTVSGFTKNLKEAKLLAEEAMRRNDRGGALQIAAIQFAGPLAEYRLRVRRSLNTAALSRYCRDDKMTAFRMFCYAKAVAGEATFSYDTGDVDFSAPVLRGLESAWIKWKNEAYTLAKMTLDAPGVSAVYEKIAADMLGRLRRGREVKIAGADIKAALTITAPP
jgi:hypothetical protein